MMALNSAELARRIDAVETVTYGELLERAEYIAGYLRKEFVENRTGLVAIRMKKSVNQIAAVMGVLIAGFSYLPIDIKQPLARQEKILSKANVIVELDEKKVNMILQNLEYRLEKHPEFQNPIAYVIFTSGSTGEPKGVVMSHTAAQNTLISIENMYNISEEDTILGIAELSFDLSVFDIFSVLGVGGTLVLPNPEKGPDASHWGRLLNEYKVTLWNSVPAQAEMLDAFASKSESYPTVRLVLLSGDWINTSLPGRLRKIMTNAQMISLGGATEGGIWSIYHEIDEIEERPTILYGKALLGQWMGVVDEELRICPEYVSGQIAIGGYSLAEGYLGDTTLTKEKFVYLEEEKNRIYLTGDNGRYVENGDIEFLGRLDNQVKINGHRIEIAEIENAIRGMQNIEDC
ncbi:amino acid adenylation domain-containing protein [Fusicatenibacter saccharivorans]|nr:Phenyloxazoline synthase MbtB [Fusicatenibacter saccharivorans]